MIFCVVPADNDNVVFKISEFEFEEVFNYLKAFRINARLQKLKDSYYLFVDMEEKAMKGMIKTIKYFCNRIDILLNEEGVDV